LRFRKTLQKEGHVRSLEEKGLKLLAVKCAKEVKVGGRRRAGTNGPENHESLSYPYKDMLYGLTHQQEEGGAGSV
jgi:hypothetical protein